MATDEEVINAFAQNAAYILKLEAQIARLEQQLSAAQALVREAYGDGWQEGRQTTSVTGDWTYDYEAWAALAAIGEKDERQG